MKKNIMYILLMFIVFSCKKTETENQLPIRYDVPVLFAAEVSNYGLRKIDFNLKIAALRGNNESQEDIEEFTGIPADSFKFQNYIFGTDSVIFHTNAVTYEHDSSAMPYFTSVMLDQSASPESFDLNDYYNLRFQAINGYLNKLSGNGSVLISGFARNGLLNGNIEYCNTEPVSFWDRTTAINLLDMTHKIGGTSCLYDALDRMMDRMITMPVQNKSIVVLVINKDDSLGLANQEAVIQKAKNNNIKINLIWLIDNWHYVDFSALTELPCRTGGFLIYMGDKYQISTIFLGLDKLLTKRVNFYNLDVSLTVDSPSTFAEKYTDGVKIYYPNSSYYKWNYIPFILSKYGK